MAKRSEIFKTGKFLRAADLNGKAIVLTIERAPLEELTTPDGKTEKKVVLYFVGAKKGLPLNVTNFNSCVEICDADDSDDFPGNRIELYPTTAQLKNNTVDCIRIRRPAQIELPTKTKAATKPVADDMDDAIPF